MKGVLSGEPMYLYIVENVSVFYYFSTVHHDKNFLKTSFWTAYGARARVRSTPWVVRGDGGGGRGGGGRHMFVFGGSEY